jgi:hypothetical protein
MYTKKITIASITELCCGTVSLAAPLDVLVDDGLSEAAVVSSDYNTW